MKSFHVGTQLGAEHKRPFCVTMIAALFALGVLASCGGVSAAQAGEATIVPTFQHGLWRFERTLERIMHAPNMRLLLSKEEVTRCVNPTLAMKETFDSRDVGNCHSLKPEKVDNRYIFPRRCDYMGPVRTEITVESDVAYTEVNELSVGAFPRTDTVVAHRIGGCNQAAGQGGPLEAAALYPSR